MADGPVPDFEEIGRGILATLERLDRLERERFEKLDRLCTDLLATINSVQEALR